MTSVIRRLKEAAAFSFFVSVAGMAVPCVFMLSWYKSQGLGFWDLYLWLMALEALRVWLILFTLSAITGLAGERGDPIRIAIRAAVCCAAVWFLYPHLNWVLIASWVSITGSTLVLERTVRWKPILPA